jgi:hypothetical protein
MLIIKEKDRPDAGSLIVHIKKFLGSIPVAERLYSLE